MPDDETGGEGPWPGRRGARLAPGHRFDAQQADQYPVLVADDGAVIDWEAYGDFRDSRKWPGYRFTVEHTVHVAESHWGKGIGRALVDALADHARLGFHEVALMTGIGEKWGRRLDLVLMQREIAHP